MRINVTLLLLLLLLCKNCSSSDTRNSGKNREIVTVKGDSDVVWIVQLSDLHFSVHHPERASEFQQFVGSTLSMIKPSLVFITGDLTDGKSKDLLTMKQNEEEWVEYQTTMENVIKKSGLDKSIFYDVRGNHDNFGVPTIGGSYDYFSNYSINGQLGRSQSVHSVTLQTATRDHLFVSFDTTTSTGLRGPTNVFGHPTDQLLTDLNSHLSQHAMSAKPLTKITLGHFPLSFSAPTISKNTLKQIFLNHSISAYLCGHLHTRFGNNLKRHHEINSHNLFQLNIHEKTPSSNTNCPNEGKKVDEFWELEMGDWRKSRTMRVLAIDKGHVSFIDINFKKGAKEILILPTYPLDSRYLSTTILNKYNCESLDDTSHSHIKALVFSLNKIAKVTAKIYDLSHGNLDTVLETPMSKNENGDNLYIVPFNPKAFLDPNPSRYWLQIEAIDINDLTTSSNLIPFSLNGFRANISWTWKEFFVMGCQWAGLYFPIFWSFYLLMFMILVLPKFITLLWKKQYTYLYFKANKGFLNLLTWVFTEVNNVPFLWKLMLAYFLLLCPWLLGQVFTEGGERGYMTYKGWVVDFKDLKKLEFIGFPDVMVIVIPHLYFVVLPAVFIILGVVVERAIYQDHVCSLSGKKRDDYGGNFGILKSSEKLSGGVIKILTKWGRRLLLILSLAVCWKHFTNCWSLMKAYEMNPLVHFPFYSFSIPFLLAYVFYKTKRL